MRLKTSTLYCGLLILAMVVLPVKSSDFDRTHINQPIIFIEISNNIATLKGHVASRQQAIQAEKLIFYTLAEIDWIENKLKIDTSITTTTQPLREAISHMEYITSEQNSG